jgi:tol-pal system protein YbgF
MKRLLKNAVLGVSLSAFSAMGQNAGHMQERLTGIEDDQRSLQGQLEELLHAVEELHREFNRLKADVDQHFSELREESEKRSTANKKEQKPPTPHEDQESSSTPLPEETAEHPLEKARAQFNAGKHQEAQEILEAYLATHPSKSDCAVAQYWLGEALFAQKHYEEAALAFVTGYKADAQGRRTPETLLKLARALIIVKKHKEACTTLKKLLRDYPEAPADIREKAENLLNQKA